MQKKAKKTERIKNNKEIWGYFSKKKKKRRNDSYGASIHDNCGTFFSLL